MAGISSVPTSALVAGGLFGGFALAQATGQRPLGGAIFAAATAASVPRWRAAAGVPGAAALAGLSVAAMGASHPLAKKIGAWPSVAAVSGVVAVAAWAVADRRS
ncbi:hypothetical protein [Nocardia vermiculata]|uniref:hypothetical protein n=1 Tax=Nocardia vermiculata TaxID=257274 RepID=UPI001B3503CB|nr:hypothetical protein [Nocardia vermiculata]